MNTEIPLVLPNPAPDRGALGALYRAAFPDEDLVPLVNDLLELPSGVLSLEARMQDMLAGHVIFTLCAVEGCVGTAALLGPLAVAPGHQHSGIGSALVKAGLEAAAKAGAMRVEVLGDPAYYGRFGFAQDDTITPPYSIPAQWKPAWQTFALTGGAASLAGRLLPPAPWMQERLWLP